jgi:hypothetical protein
VTTSRLVEKTTTRATSRTTSTALIRTGFMGLFLTVEIGRQNVIFGYALCDIDSANGPRGKNNSSNLGAEHNRQVNPKDLAVWLAKSETS